MLQIRYSNEITKQKSDKEKDDTSSKSDF